MKRRHNSIHWSDQHQALLAYCGSKVIRRCRRSGLIDIQDLMHEAWLLGLKNRAPDQLRGCGSIVVLQMYRAAADLVTGRSKFLRRTYPVTVARLDEHEAGVIDLPAPRDADGSRLVDAADELNHVLIQLDSRQREVLVWRFCEELTCQEIGNRLGLSRERARQLVIQALAAARAAAENHQSSIVNHK